LVEFVDWLDEVLFDPLPAVAGGQGRGLLTRSGAGLLPRHGSTTPATGSAGAAGAAARPIAQAALNATPSARALGGAFIGLPPSATGRARSASSLVLRPRLATGLPFS